VIPHLALYRRLPQNGAWVPTWMLFDALPWWARLWPKSMLVRALYRLKLDGVIEMREQRIEDVFGRGAPFVLRWVCKVTERTPLNE
jgi:hypothetical protein